MKNLFKKQKGNKKEIGIRDGDKAQLNETPFSIIQHSEILTKQDLATLTPLTLELKETFKKSQLFRTRTENGCPRIT